MVQFKVLEKVLFIIKWTVWMEKSLELLDSQSSTRLSVGLLVLEE